MEEIRRLSEPLRGKRLVHVSATAFGGGVAEINYALVPLMRDAGLDAEWRIIAGADEFFAATKTIHNALQGDPTGLTPDPAGGLPPLPDAERRGVLGRVRLRAHPRSRSRPG
jgi:trehalose synthase